MSKDKKKKRKESKKTPPKPDTEGSEAKQETSPPPGVVNLEALPVWQVIPFFISIFHSLAWQKMGLMVNPLSQEIQKDLEEARAAIDCYEALLTHLGENIEPEVKKMLQSRLTDLKLNFAQQS